MSRKIHTDNSTIVWQISSNVSNQSVVKLDIGGTIFKCYRETLYTFPESKLARLQEDDLVLETSTDRNEYFFDRNPVFFNIILDAYRKGVVHLPKDICGLDFKKELDFWEISPGHVAPCCWEAYYRGQSEEDTMTRLMENYRENTNVCLMLGQRTDLKERLWLFLDEPQSSRHAFIWAVFMSFIVVISTVLLCIATLPIAFDKSSEEDVKILQRMVDIFGFKNQTGKKLKDLKWNDAFLTSMAALVLIMTAEILLCFIVCPIRRQFWNTRRALTFLGYICFWITFGLELNLDILTTKPGLVIFVIVRYGIILQLFRLFDFARAIKSFNIMALTVRSSKEELKMVLFLTAILVCLFGFFMFAAEYSFNQKMNNAFSAMYWALITMTTVGYGNYVPETILGHVIACACAVCGVIILALPIGVISSNFYTFYNYHKYAERHVTEYGTHLKGKVYPYHSKRSTTVM
ncbi:potassium voltage-gated channel protein Shaw-like isoform X1 [Mya arenaria]|uniref:potassium voltage-gated channel protein Shaw-like isoform X1 n=1 Tax=Mya arenaria TaxID=6604 RepID=UPI0022E20339|nr:potassium voltage-gated channel protein Shaw-like isoform X1 [Mya arenaria]XP_052782120.1 potassium voltage-gated channel protein Shaw-like isoform X1 [Mya arenaria]